MDLEERLYESQQVSVSGAYGSIIFANPEYKGQTKLRKFKPSLPLIQAFSAGLFLMSSASTNTTANEPIPSPGGTKVLFVVGDVMHKENPGGADLVGRLLEKSLAETAGYSRASVAGDLCNDDGAPECYERLERTSWGPLRPLYWVWRIINLNSEAMRKDVHNNLLPLGLEQMAWLDSELRQHSRDKCVMIISHRPMYSSGRFASPAWVAPIFRKAFRYGVDLIVTGHEHFFASLPPLTPFYGPDNIALVDWAYGIPGLITGTGGARLFPHPTVDPNIKRENRSLKWAKYGEEVLANEIGITRIDLQPGRYQWRFIPVNPKPNYIYPSGSGVCHPNPTGYTEPPL
ncbi:metallophosphoesterase [Candidatus Woesearchaeota archaeon]|nr:metallophosphoesterase [Candidatus Woesearchaeota archaeon]